MQPVDETYFKNAPQRFSRTFLIPQPASAVWDELTGEKPLHWVKATNVTWTSARPFGVGTTREIKIAGGAFSAKEYYFLWEEGRRHCFYMSSCNLPVFETLAEDYVVEPTGDSSCEFTWTICVTPSTLGKAGGPLNRLVFGNLFRDTAKYFNAA